MTSGSVRLSSPSSAKQWLPAAAAFPCLAVTRAGDVDIASLGSGLPGRPARGAWTRGPGVARATLSGTRGPFLLTGQIGVLRAAVLVAVGIGRVKGVTLR
jgi:hypothetical protein